MLTGLQDVFDANLLLLSQLPASAAGTTTDSAANTPKTSDNLCGTRQFLRQRQAL